VLLQWMIATLTAFSLPGLAQAQAQQGAKVNLSGAYRCEPQPSHGKSEKLKLPKYQTRARLNKPHGQLVLLHHKFRRRFCGKRRAQHWHLRRLVAIATAKRRWIVAIELGTWRCGRIGGAAGSITTGNGRFFDASGGMWC